MAYSNILLFPLIFLLPRMSHWESVQFSNLGVSSYLLSLPSLRLKVILHLLGLLAFTYIVNVNSLFFLCVKESIWNETGISRGVLMPWKKGVFSEKCCLCIYAFTTPLIPSGYTFCQYLPSLGAWLPVRAFPLVMTNLNHQTVAPSLVNGWQR